MPTRKQPANDLIISGGGSISVASDVLLSHAHDLEWVRDGAAHCHRQLLTIERPASASSLRASGMPPEAAIAEREMERATSALARLRDGADASAGALRTSAERYGEAERQVGAMTKQLSAMLGYATGLFLPALVWFYLPTAATVLASVFIGNQFIPGGADAARRAFSGWWAQNRQALSDPTTVTLLRHAVSSADDGIAGRLGIPPSVQQLMGDEGLGIVGVGTSAATVALVGSQFGIFAETPVRARAVGTETTPTAPLGAAERIERIPNPQKNGTGAQIVVERYSSPGQADRFEVYLGGTVDFSPVASGQVWDLTSNVNAMAELPAGSYSAAKQALADAGVTSTSDVMFTGYSQGGLIASALAASGDYTPRGVLTVGAPAGHVDIPAHIPVVAIEHTDDLVPAFGGHRTNTEAVVVERRAYDPGAISSDRAVPAHEIGVYRETATLADKSHSNLLAAALQRFDAIPAASQATSTSYLAERVAGPR